MSKFDNLCKSCLYEIGDLEICPHCGYNQFEKQLPPFLPIGTVLEERYYIGKKVYQNAEGIGYIAFDSISDSSVYIREFFPLRRSERSNLSVEVIKGYEGLYNKQKEEFLKYFRSIAKFREFSATVPIYDIFTANNTAYVVYEWLNGITLNKFVLEHGGYINWETAKPLFMPLISLLEAMHKSGIKHLGISPENLIITDDGKMKLVGFSIPEIRRVNSNMLFQPYDGCTPIEQYESENEIAECSDIYSLAACIFFALTGKYPQIATKRKLDNRLLIPSVILKDIPPYVVSALAHALQVFPRDRTNSFEKFRTEISAASTRLPSPKNTDTKKKKELSGMTIGAISFAVAMVILIILGSIYFFKNEFTPNANTSESSESSLSIYDTSSLVSSKPDNSIEVADLIGENFENLQKELSNSGDYTILKSSDDFSDTIKNGCIMEQTPKSGEFIEKGTAIIVTVSKGPKMRTLPSISGLTLSEASLKLSSEGFSPEQINEYSDTIPAGYVIGYKSQNAGDQLEYGSTVTIAVSQGNQ